jgi:4-amino-4-deoxy-L-arabinose transferase-like glycosyltransferase
VRILPAILVFAAAIGVRLYHITDPLLEFHVTRQYRSAAIARAMYLPYDTSMPAWAREIAVLNADQGALEPTIIEHLAVYGYRLVGGEHLWIGRLVTIIGWLIGGVAIWLIGRRMMSTAGALWALIVFLLVPYGVLASRSFQPDGLMTGVTAVAILQIVRFASRDTTGNLVAAIVATALAALIKPMSLFFTMGSFIATAWPARRFKGWAFLLLSIVPMAAYYAYGLFVTGAMRGETGGRFLPHLLGTQFFWSGWWTVAQSLADPWVWLLAIIGTLTARPGPPRRLFAALWGGYLLLGVAFTYHFATHDYYHLPVLIVLALTSGAAVTWIEEAAGRALHLHRRTISAAAAIIMLVIAALWLQQSANTLRTLDRSSELATYQRIGDLLHHSRQTIMLTYDYGMPIRYHGHVTGPSWPSAGDLSAAQLGAGAGAAADSAWSSDVPSAEQRYDKFYRPHAPEYFLITDFKSLGEQPDLKRFLDATFARLAADDRFLIYDLRQKARD